MTLATRGPEDMRSIKNSTDTRLALLEQSITHIDSALTRIESKQESYDFRIDQKFNLLIDKIDSNNKWLIGLSLSIIFSLSTLLISIYNICS